MDVEANQLITDFEGPDARTEATRRPVLTVFRTGAIAQAILFIVQAAFAGSLLAGSAEASRMHELTAKVLVLLAIFQCGAAIALRVKRDAPPSIVVTSVLLVLAEVLEFAAGHFHQVALHVPLGVGIFGGALRQLFWAIEATRHRGIGR
jgi:hypothetical protein